MEISTFLPEKVVNIFVQNGENSKSVSIEMVNDSLTRFNSTNEKIPCKYLRLHFFSLGYSEIDVQ